MADLADVATLKRLCNRYGIRPDPDAGQHFLVNRDVLAATVAAAKLSPADTVLEVGPGFGTLTVELARRVSRVIAVELDPKLAAAAREILQPYPNVQIILGDFLTLPPTTYKLSAKSYKLVANLPYGITGRFFRRVLSGEERPQLIVVMVQSEVAKRITAPPGKLGMLSVLCQLYGKPRIVGEVRRDNFWPAPSVASAVVALPVRSAAELDELLFSGAVTPEKVLRISRVGFAARRKTLANNLMTLRQAVGSELLTRVTLLQAFSEAGVNPSARAQDLSVPQWITLAKKLENCLN